MLVYLLSTSLLFVVDRFFKTLFLLKPTLLQGAGFIDLSINKNIAFSLPLSYFILYPLVFLIIFFLLWQWFIALRKKSVLIWPWALVIIGAISNLIDRLRYGGVIDFINVPYFTVLNISDIYISIGVVWLIYYSWFYKKG